MRNNVSLCRARFRIKLRDPGKQSFVLSAQELGLKFAAMPPQLRSRVYLPGARSGAKRSTNAAEARGLYNSYYGDNVIYDAMERLGLVRIEQSTGGVRLELPKSKKTAA
jgi:hypothetical protein